MRRWPAFAWFLAPSLREMKILLTGASGFIGSALADHLLLRHHRVVRAGRAKSASPLSADAGSESVAVDFAKPPPCEWWLPHLREVDVVVNTVGIFQEDARHTFDAVHAQAPIALFTACAQAGVSLVIQVSALGADEHAVTAFHQSKRLADETLRRLPVTSVIVQPSLVYAPEGASAALFNQLALLPAVALPATSAPVQPVALRDLVVAITRLIEEPPAQSCTIEAVGPEAMSLRAYLGKLRNALGNKKRQAVVEIPLPWITTWARWLSWMRLRPTFANPDSLRMLAQGNSADPAAFAGLLAQTPTPVDSFLQPRERQRAREQAQLQILLVLMKFSVALVWIATGLLSLGIYPVHQSLQLLADFGLEGAWAHAALYAGAGIDLLLGFAVLVAPRRWLPFIWRAQLLVIMGYTALITLRVPHWWLHPFGPILKNLPMLAGIAMLATLPRRP